MVLIFYYFKNSTIQLLHYPTIAEIDRHVAVYTTSVATSLNGPGYARTKVDELGRAPEI